MGFPLAAATSAAAATLQVQQSANGVGRSSVVLLDCVGVDVHRERCGRVAQAVLDRLDVSALADKQRRLRVAQLMQIETVEPATRVSLDPLAVVPDFHFVERAQPMLYEEAATPFIERRWRYEPANLVRADRRRAGHVPAAEEQIGLHDHPFGEKLNGTVVDGQVAFRLFALGVSAHALAIKLLMNVNALANKIDVVPDKPKSFASANACGQGEPYGHDSSVAARRFEVVRQLHRLLLSKGAALLGLRALDVVDEIARVTLNDLLLHRLLQHLAEFLVQLVQGAGGHAVLAEPRVRLVDRRCIYLLYRRASEDGLDALDLDLVALERERGKARYSLAALMKLACIGAHLEHGVLVVQLLLKLRAVLLHLNARFGFIAVNRALWRPFALSAWGFRWKAKSDAIQLSALNFDDGPLAVYDDALLVQCFSQLPRFCAGQSIASSGPIGGPEVVPPFKHPQEIPNHTNLLTWGFQSIIDNTNQEQLSEN